MVLAHDPMVLAHDPMVLAHDPMVLAHDPMVLAHDRMVLPRRLLPARDRVPPIPLLPLLLGNVAVWHC
jgi:hypothetical protein